MSALGVGILWLLDPGITLEENVRRALARYNETYVEPAEYIHVNAQDVPRGLVLCGLPVRATTDTLKKHIFIGRPGMASVRAFAELGTSNAK